LAAANELLRIFSGGCEAVPLLEDEPPHPANAATRSQPAKQVNRPWRIAAQTSRVAGALRTLCLLTRPGWLDASELRIGLGCMRLSTEPERDEELADQTVAAAVEAGITVFDTARAYGRDETELGRGERLLAAALRRAGAASRARIVTKGGMTRPAGAWIPDGRAKAILADCEASLAALAGLAIDLYLIHAPDPRTPWATSVRALGRLLAEGMVQRVGLSNVNRRQLDEAVELAPVAAVEVALSVYDDRALRGGIVARCEELGIAVIAHSPLGGPRRAGGLARRTEVATAARDAAASPAEVALAWLLELSPVVVAIPGARRPETARSAARAASLSLDRDVLAALGPAGTARATPVAAADAADAEVVLIMGIPGAGKTRLAETYQARGYLRLNRDERGGALRELAEELERRLEAGARQVVLDNTYLTRAARSYVIEAAGRHGVPTRCVWIETPLAQAQVNLVERLLDRFGALPSPDDLRALARREPGALGPTQQMRTLRELEPPSTDEGFAGVGVIPFVRGPAPPAQAGAGVFVAAAVLGRPGWERALDSAEPAAPHLVFDWSPDGSADDLAPLLERLRVRVAGPAEGALCPHGGGPPRCWCRPPLPGLPLAFARARGVDPARSILIGTSTAHRTLATTLQARYVAV
jgi:aryl-alcohol dehydrogenase-like predicted oxidoreductase/predicted kinase